MIQLATQSPHVFVRPYRNPRRPPPPLRELLLRLLLERLELERLLLKLLREELPL